MAPIQLTLVEGIDSEPPPASLEAEKVVDLTFEQRVLAQLQAIRVEQKRQRKRQTISTALILAVTGAGDYLPPSLREGIAKLLGALLGG